MTNGQINSTELVAALICKKNSFVEGIRNVQSVVEGSMTLLLLTENGIYAARDLLGRTPVVIGKKENAYCVSFESFAYINLGYTDYKELGPGEIVYVTSESLETVSPACEKMRICSFLWVYYGYPTSSYEGVGVDEMRCNCGKLLAQRGDHSIAVDIVTGVPDSGIAQAIGYANESGIPYARPFIKYTPTWPRSFMPTTQSQRNLIARMRLIPVHSLIEDRSLLLIDDSIVRGTQLRETTEFLYQSGAKEVHVCISSPPVTDPCQYGIDTSVRKELIASTHTEDEICQYIGADSLHYISLEGLKRSLSSMDPEAMCYACFNAGYPDNAEETIRQGSKYIFENK